MQFYDSMGTNAYSLIHNIITNYYFRHVDENRNLRLRPNSHHSQALMHLLMSRLPQLVYVSMPHRPSPLRPQKPALQSLRLKLHALHLS